MSTMSADKFGARTTCDDVTRGIDLCGKSILITGANSGIGFEAARALAAAGARTWLACRNVEAGAETRRHIVARHADAEVHVVGLDLASFASVRRASQELPSKLDVVVCNAGLYANHYQTTEDGLESTVGVCHFGHFLLVNLLIERLAAAGTSRVVMVSSESHRHPSKLQFARFPLDRAGYRPLVSYGQAKLCNVLFANELTRRYQHRGIFSNSLHPGAFIGTSIFRSSRSAQLLATALSPFTKTIPQGAATTVYCATAPELARVGGRYYADCREGKASAGAKDVEAAARLWQLSAARVGLAPADAEVAQPQP